MKLIKEMSLSLLLMQCPLFAQVGVNTNIPKSKLDVEGDVVIRGPLRVGGSDLIKGNAGEKDQVLVSQGEGKAPLWKYVKVPFMENGQYKLINTYVVDDDKGISDLSAPDNKPLSNLGEQYTAAWHKISGLSTSIEIKAEENKVTYQLQAGIEASTPTGNTVGEVKFICGIFKNNILVALRPDKIQTLTIGTPIQYIYTLNYTEENAVKGIHKVEVACRRKDGANHQFRVGTNISNSTNSNSFALKSFLKIDLAELVTFKTRLK
ncbi:hypothetical protein [Empedobacter tilapiae]|uniref:hypothetical protein n=1 Tax=Empedobacter tilapiae TaxID=2491114 RepID=UPI0028D3E0D5|nr:hypothetical protein [Empedobacter tilapiae]